MDKIAKLHFMVTKEDRLYEFIAPAGAPFGETHDVIYEILKDILAMAEKHAQSLEKSSDKDDKTIQES